METFLQYIIPVFAIALLAGGWMSVQLIAKRMNIRNYIDKTSGCCGACDECDEKEVCMEKDIPVKKNFD